MSDWYFFSCDKKRLGEWEKYTDYESFAREIHRSWKFCWRNTQIMIFFCQGNIQIMKFFPQKNTDCESFVLKNINYEILVRDIPNREIFVGEIYRFWKFCLGNKHIVKVGWQKNIQLVKVSQDVRLYWQN